MREILFRGKPTERFADFKAFRPDIFEGDWVYGSLMVCEGRYYICTYAQASTRTTVLNGSATMVEVEPESVGEWTGMFDKDGTKIFEGDILSTRTTAVRTEKLKGYFGYDTDGYPQKVEGYEGASEYHYTYQKDSLGLVEWSTLGRWYLTRASVAVNAICNKVVGNIYDNPELLKGETK